MASWSWARSIAYIRAEERATGRRAAVTESARLSESRTSPPASTTTPLRHSSASASSRASGEPNEAVELTHTVVKKPARAPVSSCRS